MNQFRMFRYLLLLAVTQQSAAKFLRSLSERDPNCVDTTATFHLDQERNDDPKDCSWLAQNRYAVVTGAGYPSVDDLCELHAISSLCRVTCEVCQETSAAVDLLKTCSDSADPVFIPSMETSVTCAWIQRNKHEQGDLCALTKVALHCPRVCGTFGFCVTEEDENA